MTEKIKNFGWGYILTAILLAMAGICFTALKQSLYVLALTLGVVLILYGIVYFVLNLSDKRRGAIFALRTFLSVIFIICGTVTCILRDNAIAVIATVCGLFLIIDGSFKLHTAVLSKRYAVFGWWLTLILSVITIAGGFYILKFTPSDISALSLILGITLIFDALSNFTGAFYIAVYERRMSDDIYYSVYAKSVSENEKSEAAKDPCHENGTESEGQTKPDKRKTVKARGRKRFPKLIKSKSNDTRAVQSKEENPETDNSGETNEHTEKQRKRRFFRK